MRLHGGVLLLVGLLVVVVVGQDKLPCEVVGSSLSPLTLNVDGSVTPPLPACAIRMTCGGSAVVASVANVTSVVRIMASRWADSVRVADIIPHATDLLDHSGVLLHAAGEYISRNSTVLSPGDPLFHELYPQDMLTDAEWPWVVVGMGGCEHVRHARVAQGHTTLTVLPPRKHAARSTSDGDPLHTGQPGTGDGERGAVPSRFAYDLQEVVAINTSLLNDTVGLQRYLKRQAIPRASHTHPEGAVSFLQLDSLHRVLGGALKMVLTPVINIVAEDILSESQRTLAQVVTAKCNGVSPAQIVELSRRPLSRNISNMIVDGVSQKIGELLPQVLVEALGPQIHDAVLAPVIPLLVVKLQPLLEPLVENRLIERLPDVLERSLPGFVVESLTKSVSRSVVGALTASLSPPKTGVRDPKWRAFDGPYEEELSCRLCFLQYAKLAEVARRRRVGQGGLSAQQTWQYDPHTRHGETSLVNACRGCRWSPLNLYYSQYYGHYFSEYYSEYYAAYYAKAWYEVEKVQYQSNKAEPASSK